MLLLPVNVQAASMDGAAETEEVQAETESAVETVAEETEAADETVAEETEPVKETVDEETAIEEAESKAVTEEETDFAQDESRDEGITEESESKETTEENTDSTLVVIPEVVGLSETDAVETLEEVELPDGSFVEVIKKYEYSVEIEADFVMEQNIVGEVSADDCAKVELVISMGEEPEELLEEETLEEDALSTFGLSAYMENCDYGNSQYGIDWNNLPHSFEYNWDNSQNCWQWGVWIDGVCYKTPEGTYSTDVRHKVQLHCDGTYVYLRIIFSRDYGAKANGDAYNFFIDDKQASFAVRFPGSKDVITNNTGRLSPGTHQLVVIHGDRAVSGREVNGASAYITKKEDDVNAELEVKIPLAEMKVQNDSIDLEHMSKVQFQCSNLTGNRRITASGADTMPMVSTVMAFMLIPGSTVLLKKYGKRKKDSDEQNV